MKTIVTVTNKILKSELLFAELLIGSGNTPSFSGELLAINPSREEFVTYDENFAEAVRRGYVGEVVEGVVYFDTGVKRAFIVPLNMVEISVTED